MNPSPELPRTPADGVGRPRVQVSVLMRRVPDHGSAARWQPWRWVLDDVVPQQPQRIGVLTA